MQPANMGARATAAIVDGLLVFFVLGWIVAAAAGQTLQSTEDQHNVGFNLRGWPAIGWLVLAIGYFTVFEHLWGATIGKRLFSIHVRGRSTPTPSWGESAARNVLRIVDGFPYVLPYLVGFIAASTRGNEQRQRLGDRAAGTAVVSSR